MIAWGSIGQGLKCIWQDTLCSATVAFHLTPWHSLIRSISRELESNLQSRSKDEEKYQLCIEKRDHLLQRQDRIEISFIMNMLRALNTRSGIDLLEFLMRELCNF